MKKINYDPQTLTLLSIYYGQQNGIRISGVDKLIEMAEQFEKEYPTGFNWQDAKQDWTDTVALFYNQHKPADWKPVKFHNDITADPDTFTDWGSGVGVVERVIHSIKVEFPDLSADPDSIQSQWISELQGLIK